MLRSCPSIVAWRGWWLKESFERGGDLEELILLFFSLSLLVHVLIAVAFFVARSYIFIYSWFFSGFLSAPICALFSFQVGVEVNLWM